MTDEVQTLVVFKSANQKTGAVALSTYRTQLSCPVDCALYGAGCYAENGIVSPFGHAGRGSVSLDRLRDGIARLKAGDVVRFNVSGDYLKADGTPDHEYIEVTNSVPEHITVISYTHAWRRLRPEWFAKHTRPNASCDTPIDVALASAAGWATVIVDNDGSLPGAVIDGRRFVQCLFETKGKQCIECKLCAHTSRPSAVVFVAHGTRKRAAREALEARRTA